MFMSFFFFIVTLLTLLASHAWARRTRPIKPASFDWTKNFQGDLKTFQKQLEKMVAAHPQLLLLEKTDNKYLISESPSFFEFGHFYHFHCQEKEGQVTVQMQVQAKLVNPNTKKVEAFFERLEDDNVG